MLGRVAHIWPNGQGAYIFFDCTLAGGKDTGLGTRENGFFVMLRLGIYGTWKKEPIICEVDGVWRIKDGQRELFRGGVEVGADMIVHSSTVARRLIALEVYNDRARLI